MTEAPDDSEVISSRTGAGLMKFYEVKIKKHELSKGVVSPLRSASKRILEVEDDPLGVDLTNLDVNQLVKRFRIKNRAELTDESFAAYESRFRRGLRMYLGWLDNDPNWTGKVRSNRAGTAKTGKTTKNMVSDTDVRNTRTTLEQAPADQELNAAGRNVAHSDSRPELFDYPVALVDSNVTAILRLPRTYTTGDAARMAALINALAVPSATSSLSCDA
ncbi:MAG: hypothetical protein ABIZ05_14330 [Pseudonocardiaceae bacterium]